MKIRSRLIIAFCIMIFFPLLTLALSAHLVLNEQADRFTSTLVINQVHSHAKESNFLMRPLEFIYQVGIADFENLEQIADRTPEKFDDKNFLASLDKELAAKDTFLIFLKNRATYYVNNNSEYVNKLPVSFSSTQHPKKLTYLDESVHYLVKEKSFYYADHAPGHFFVITDLTKFTHRWTSAIEEIFISFILILLSTAFVLVFWLYRSIILPLNILHLATAQIGDGNLEQSIVPETDDEIADICRDFEKMRIHLKEIVDQQVQAEQNSRTIMSNISHDLKTPITAIKGYTEGILDGVADTPEKQQRYLRTIYAKATDMAYLIDELSIFSKVQRNSLAYNFTAINLEQYFADCIDDFSLDLESRNISIDYYNTTLPTTMIQIDPEQMKRVLFNLVENAAKYNDKENGHISIRIEDFSMEEKKPPLYRQLKEDGTSDTPPEDNYILVQIEDNGPGIAAKDLPHIFERFFRADASRNSSKRGSGLGLTIVKLIISDHGGEIWAESIEGVGTTFYFTLKKADMH